MNTVPSTEDLAEPPLAQLLLDFQSLGDNCEFGLLQRYCGSEPLGLFRFANTPLAPLLRALEEEFAQLVQPDGIEIALEPDGQFMVCLHPYGFTYHTFLHSAHVSVAQLRATEVRRLGFLRRSLLGELRAGRKLFVRKGDPDPAGMAALHAALRRYGPASLLWVTTADGAHLAGVAERAAEGLLRGYVDRFALPVAGTPDLDISMASWVSLCRSAAALWRNPAAKRVNPAPPPRPADLLPAGESRSDSVWAACLHTGQARVPPSPVPDGAVLCHVLPPEGCEGELGGGYAAPYPTSGMLYTMSAQVWIPAGFTGRGVSVLVRGLSSVRQVQADLARRDCWQDVCVAVFPPVGASWLQPALQVDGPGAQPVFSAAWRIARGLVLQPSTARGPAVDSPMLQEGSIAGDGWFITQRGQLLTAPPPLRSGRAVMLHCLPPDRPAAVFRAPTVRGVAPGAVHIVSAWLWLPAGFAGSEAGVFLDSLPSLRLANADLALREVWQRVWAAVIADARGVATPALHLLGPVGEGVFSTCWRLQEAVAPDDGDAAFDPAAHAAGIGR